MFGLYAVLYAMRCLMDRLVYLNTGIVENLERDWYNSWYFEQFKYDRKFPAVFILQKTKMEYFLPRGKFICWSGVHIQF